MTAWLSLKYVYIIVYTYIVLIVARGSRNLG